MLERLEQWVLKLGDENGRAQDPIIQDPNRTIMYSRGYEGSRGEDNGNGSS